MILVGFLWSHKGAKMMKVVIIGWTLSQRIQSDTNTENKTPYFLFLSKSGGWYSFTKISTTER